MKQIVTFILMSVLATFLSGCEEHHANAKRHHFKDGRWAVQADDGFWYWYILTQSPTTAGSSGYYRGVSAPASSGDGGWVKGNPPTKAEEEEEEVEQVEFNEENGEISEVSEAPPSEATESSSGESSTSGESSSSSSSGGESSGGGDSGGGGGVENKIPIDPSAGLDFWDYRHGYPG